MTSIQKICPFLMFNGPVDEPAQCYVSVFPNSTIRSSSPMSASIVVHGTEILMFNGGPYFTFSPGMSLFVKCEDQAEVDRYWSALLAGGGREDNCGWLQDRWGVSWQIIPDALGRWLGDPDRAKADRVMQAMLKMKKIAVADLERAASAFP